ncbi:hypothetical protein RhiirC2_741248 [Rhizophagus irregularis]|uniref:Uncharacterized protein n=1 Tax=Rhizophagus irregularis TaxID=588596 RepID=A0A2N1NH55_9GLOM|nr:hypothetical protein RhiirC2_741248 [Rhizophagus irregularis]
MIQIRLLFNLHKKIKELLRLLMTLTFIKVVLSATLIHFYITILFSYISYTLFPTITKQQQMNVLEEIFCVDIFR